MTYCLGWKTGKTIIVAADAAITGSAHDQLPLVETSFREPHLVSSKGKVIEERALKTFNIGSRLILTYTGKTVIADNLVQSVTKAINDGIDPLEAVKLGLALNVKPDNPQIGIIFGFFEGDNQVLMSYNVTKPMEFDAHDSIVQAGSIFPKIKDLTEDYLGQAIEESDDIQIRMVKLLAVLQSYGRAGPLMVAGVGGVFACIGLNKEGAHDQPDTLHTFHYKDRNKNAHVTVCMRRGCIVVKPHDKPGLCLTNRMLNEGDAAVRERTRLACEDAKQTHAKGRYSFIVFQNLDHLRIAIVEMKRKKKHELIWLEPFSALNGSGLATFINPALSRILDQSIPGESAHLVYFLPYELPSANCLIAPIYERSKKREPIPPNPGGIGYKEYLIK